MTSSSPRGRPRRATSHISVRVAHALLGATTGVVWLLLPGMTTAGEPPVALARPAPAASRAAPQQDETSPTNLVLPIAAVAAAGLLAGYAVVRHTRRTRSRTAPAPPSRTPPPGRTAPPGRTPPATGTGPPPGELPARPYTPTPAELDRQAQAALVEADDCVRTSREELGFARQLYDEQRVEPFTRALREAESELAAAFALRQRYDEGLPQEEERARRHTLAGIAGRCAEAGRVLDAQAAAFDELRSLHSGLSEAASVAEARFRALAARPGQAQATLAGLGERYAHSALEPVTGYVETAKDRLVTATSRLNEARQAADRGESGRAVARLRSGETAVAQAEVFVTAVERLARELDAAGAMLPAALTGAEAELAAARRTSPADIPPGELRSRILHADAVLTSVRGELTGGRPYDPLEELRRIVRALAPVAAGRAGVLPAAARLAAGSAVAAADGFLGTHRDVVGAEARTRLAAATRALASGTLPDLVRADSLATESRALAEQDARLHGPPPDPAPLAWGGPATRRRHDEPAP
ncbi:hypothetical protein ACF1AX_32385 [Streptomyces sp. NPDC014802]|uniref:hypothetical protein n=1 Tax=unclassified Streptomyces TaxID=2593676 RepID=UPI0037018044